MSTQEPKTDYFGNDMVWVESYDGFLPNSENIPTHRPTKGVSGVSHEGEIYCVDCAIDMGIIDRSDLTKHRLDKPYTGLVFPRHETDTQYHCGCHEHCVNSVSGEEHPYNHDCEIGIGIEETVLQH